MEWNFGIQHSITPSLTASVDYVGNASRHLMMVDIETLPLSSWYAVESGKKTDPRFRSTK